MANTVSILSYNNTFGDWVTNTNLLTKENNDLAANNYYKNTGILFLNNPSLGLQVSNNALFQGQLQVFGTGSSAHIQNNLQVDRQVYFTNTELGLINSGQANIGGPLLALGSGTGLTVSNNALIGNSIVITHNTTSDNVYTYDLFVTDNITVGNNVSVGKNTYTNLLQANTSVNTATLSVTGISYTNLLQANSRVNTATLSVTGISYTNVLQANSTVNTATLSVTGTSYTDILQANSTVYTNLLQANSTVNTASLSVTGTSYTNLLQANTSVNTATLSVTGISYANLLQANSRVNTATLSVTGTSYTNVLQANTDIYSYNIQVDNQLTVEGNFVINGNTVYNSPRFTINEASSIGLNSTFEVKRGSSGANASIRWNEVNDYWDILDVNTGGTYSQIMTANMISSSITSTSTSTVASSQAANTLNNNINTANTALKSYVDGKISSTTSSIGAATGTTTVNNNLVVSGDLTINGTTSTINSTIITVDDINIELGSVATPTDVTAAGGGITLKGATDKTITWSSTNGWTSSETFNLSSGKTFKINGIDVLSGSSLGAGITGSSLTSVGTITSGTWSGSFGAVSGANLTGLTAGNLTGTIPSSVLGNSTHYIGTTAVTLNRASGNLGLTGISSVTLPGSTSGTVQLIPTAVAGTTTLTLPATTGTVITSGDSGTVTSTMIADGTIVNGDISGSAGIAISKLAASTISGVALGSNLNTLTMGVGTYLTGSATYNGSGATTFTVGTNATNANTGSTIVARDASGNFSAGTITATLNGNATTATTLTGDQTNWSSYRSSAVSNMLGWKNFGNGHVIFDASNGTSPTGSAVNNTNAAIAWVATYPTLMGWNGTSTYGVRVDSARVADLANALNTSNSYQVASLGVGTSASGTTGEIRSTNSITAYYSDDNLKTRLGNIDNALEKVLSLNGFYYEANETAQSLGYIKKKEVGISAQEVQKVIPEIVVPAPIDDKYLTVHYERLIPLLIESIKELKTEIDNLKK